MSRPSLKLLSFALLGLVACTSRTKKDENWTRGNGKPSPSFAQVRDQVFIPKCLTCHHHQSDFTDYAKTYAAREDIQRRTFVDRTMPRDGALTAAELKLLKQWLDGGAPEEEVKAPDGAPIPPPAPPLLPSPA